MAFTFVRLKKIVFLLFDLLFPPCNNVAEPILILFIYPLTCRKVTGFKVWKHSGQTTNRLTVTS